MFAAVVITVGVVSNKDVKLVENTKGSVNSVSEAALSIVNPKIRYVASYVKLDYPGGDVPANTGVCSDVVIRTYRELGIDLQKEVHEDMLQNFHLYPNKWGLTKPDPNIDHRRVPNLMVYFSRFGKELPITKNPQDYSPGDIIVWDLSGRGTTHIGIITDVVGKSGAYAIVHNIGRGQELQDCFYMYSGRIIGHYSY